ncbi:bacterio-opsin activator [Halostagnicola larsenii XH-48]|uniref:Bacterio-opsin activator n=1 Tax=Halostagnicola larsenii XH-48 TaxID=797299 RepID=W0JMR8_9EURY|nr:bacterio-opsin activator domain-containing protein [Halostagnicola larsenii]AHF99878.1 bacterio-opsin activator [Halostagnicola larsenii XH-48]
MSLFGEFDIPAEAFALQDTLEELPDVVIEIERVVATEELLAPYFWVNGDDIDEFETVTETDPSVRNLRRLDDFDRSTLFRADWTENTDTIVYAYTHVGATILEASGQYNGWTLCIRFDEHEDLSQFQDYCDQREIPFQLVRLHELTQPRTGSQYGLTRKQHDALLAAYEMEYFDSADVALADVAAELDITPQSLSELLHRGYRSLVEQTLVVTSE